MCVYVYVRKADAPTQSAVKNVFIRGSVVRYVHLPANAVDVPLLEDATRRGTSPPPPPLLYCEPFLLVRLWNEGEVLSNLLRYLLTAL